MNFIRSLSIILLIIILAFCIVPVNAADNNDTPVKDDQSVEIVTNQTKEENATSVEKQTSSSVLPNIAPIDDSSQSGAEIKNETPSDNVHVNVSSPSEKTDPPEKNQTTSTASDLQKAYAGWYEKGLNASKSGNYKSASEAFAAALRIDKRSPDAQLGYATALSELGRDGEALEIYSTLHNLSPNNTDILIPLAKAQNAAGNYDMALINLLNATSIYPDKPEGWDQLAAAYAGLSRYEEALTAVRRSLQISLDDAGGWSELGSVLYGQGRFYEAIAAFEKSLTLDPAGSSTWIGLGDTWAALSRYDNAVEALTTATKTRPSDPRLWMKLGSVYEKKGDLTKASEAYKNAGMSNLSDINATEIKSETESNQTLLNQSPEVQGNGTEEIKQAFPIEVNDTNTSAS